MKADLKLALTLLLDAQIAVSTSLEAAVRKATEAGEVSPFSDLQAGLREIQDRSHDMFVQLEGTLKETE